MGFLIEDVGAHVIDLSALTFQQSLTPIALASTGIESYALNDPTDEDDESVGMVSLADPLQPPKTRSDQASEHSSDQTTELNFWQVDWQQALPESAIDQAIIDLSR